MQRFGSLLKPTVIDIMSEYDIKSYNALTGFPISSALLYADESTNDTYLIRADMLEWFDFYSGINGRIPRSLDIRDLGGVNEIGNAVLPNSDYRMSYLIEILCQRYGCENIGLKLKFQEVGIMATKFCMNVDDLIVFDIYQDENKINSKNVMFGIYGIGMDGEKHHFFDFNSVETAEFVSEKLNEMIKNQVKFSALKSVSNEAQT